jgi:multidrug efflux pump subunit AcrB
MNAAGYAIKNKTVTLVAVVLTVVIGSFAYFKIGRLEDPEFTIKEAVIFTSYPGATAEEVELEVTEPLEAAVQQLKQLKEVRSISRPDSSVIFAEMQEIYDKATLPQVWDELRRKISKAAKSLPPGCGEPVVNDDFGDVYGVLFAITGDGYSLHDLKEVAKDLRKELLLCEDVGKIDFWGLPTDVIYVEIDRVKLSRLGLSPEAVFDAISRQNEVISAGEVKVGPENIFLRVSGDYGGVGDLGEQLVPGGSDGRMIRIKDIARIKAGCLEPPTEIMRYDGKPAVGLGISTVSGGNVIAMGDAIKARLASLKHRMPVGIELHPIAHQSETVREAVRGFVFNLIAASLIVVLLLIFFMGLREGFVIGAVLVLTILGTLACMLAMDITLQRISLGALVIALGMLVDNAIVVTEGYVAKVKNGMNRTEAAEQAVEETQWPLLGATLIAILAFAAITLSKDMTGEWLKSLFQTIFLSLGLSWVFAITVTPYLCVSCLKAEGGKNRQASCDSFFYRHYRRFVALYIEHRRWSLAVVTVMLFAALGAFSLVKQDFMPDMNRPQFIVDIWMPEGTHIEKTSEELKQIEKYITGMDGVSGVSSFIGCGSLRFLLTYEPQMTNSAYGQLLVTVDDFRKIPSLIPRLSKYLDEKHPGVVSSVDTFKLGPGGGAVETRLIGPDINTLWGLAEKVKAVMQADKCVRSLRNDWGNKVKAETVDMAGARAWRIAIGRSEIAESMAMNFSGSTAGVYRRKDELLPIIMRPRQSQRLGIDNLDNVQVWSKVNHCWIPLGQVSDGRKTVWEDPVIRRLNRMRTMAVSCKPLSGTTDALFRRLRPQIEKIPLPPDYTLEWGGEYEAATEANGKLMSKVPLAFIAMFMISVMLFNTLRHSLIIFLGLPLATIGVAPAMLLADKAFGFMAMLGVLSLSGMLIKNEIVLLDQINLELKNGKIPYEAVLDSAISRVRPVCMAAFTTVLGMIPLLWDAFFAPMSVAIMGGLTFATILTLVVVPVLYCTFFRISKQ